MPLKNERLRKELSAVRAEGRDEAVPNIRSANDTRGRNSVAVAQAFVDIAHKEGEELNLQQLIKLAYFAHGWMLSIHRRPLLTDPIVAWKGGPFIWDIYNAARHFREEPVSGLMTSTRLEELDSDQLDIVLQTYEIYGGMFGL